nr:uncharacterized protein LOC109149872 [Ipomoea trifida]
MFLLSKIALLWYTSMSSDDSQNNSARDYDNQYDDEVISESGGSSPGHSDDVEVVDARPVGGRPANARPTAPIQSTSSKAPPKKMGKVPKGEGTSSKPKGKSTSKPNTTGGNDVDDTPTEMTIREEEQTKSTSKRPMEVAEADPPTDVHAADPKRAWLAGEKPGLTDALACGTFSLLEMFNMFFQMSSPPANFVNENTDFMAGQVAHHISQATSGTTELFVRANVDVTHHNQEIRELKEKALANGIEDWEQVRALLPEQIPPLGLEPFSDPPVGLIDPHNTDSRSHVP